MVIDRSRLEQELEKTRRLYSTIQSLNKFDVARFHPVTQRHHREALARLEERSRRIQLELEQLSKGETH